MFGGMFPYSSKVTYPCFYILYASFLCVFGQKYLVHPCNTLGIFCLTSYLLGWTALQVGGDVSWILASFLGPSSLQDLTPWDASKQIFEETRACFPEVQGCDLGFYPPHCLQESELHNLMVTAAKAVFDLRISNKSLIPGEYEAQQTTSPCWPNRFQLSCVQIELSNTEVANMFSWSRVSLIPKFYVSRWLPLLRQIKSRDGWWRKQCHALHGRTHQWHCLS